MLIGQKMPMSLILVVSCLVTMMAVCVARRNPIVFAASLLVKIDIDTGVEVVVKCCA